MGRENIVCMNIDYFYENIVFDVDIFFMYLRKKIVEVLLSLFLKILLNWEF